MRQSLAQVGMVAQRLDVATRGHHGYPSWHQKHGSGDAIVVGVARHPSRASVQRWIGVSLIVASVTIAIGIIMFADLPRRQHEVARETFARSLVNFGPTPTPLSARATPSVQGGVVGTPGARYPDGTTVPVVLPSNITPAPMIAETAPSALVSHAAVATPPTPEPISQPARQATPTHIAIPAIGVDFDVVEVGVSPIVVDGQEVYIWDVAPYAVGHHFSSANPGEGDNVVLSGHNDLQGEVFRDLWQVVPGTQILVQTGGKTWSYRVEAKFVLQENGAPLEQRLENARYVDSTGDERLTLVTCWPYGISDHRLIVVARPDGPVPDEFIQGLRESATRAVRHIGTLFSRN